MSKTAIIQARIEPELKARVEAIFKRMGMSTSDAMNMFFNQVDMEQALPFKPKVPSAELQESLDDFGLNRNITTYNSLEDFKKAYHI